MKGAGLNVSRNWAEACGVYFLQLGEIELNCDFWVGPSAVLEDTPPGHRSPSPPKPIHILLHAQRLWSLGQTIANPSSLICI